MEMINIWHPNLPDCIVSVPEMSFEHHSRGGWRKVEPVPDSETIREEDLPSLIGQTPKDGE